MWRLFTAIIFAGLAAVAAAISAALVARLAPAGADTVATGAAAAVAGMLFGLFYAWTRRIPWSRFRAAWLLWQTQLARQVWWAAAGVVSVAVLVYY